MSRPVLLETSLPIPAFVRGKVRDTYELGEHLLMVTTDRLSAFDCVLPNGIPDKGEVLTRLSSFWFHQTGQICQNHLVSTSVADLPDLLAGYADQLEGRFMLVHKAQRVDYECVVRGYLAGSGWKEYQETGTVCGIRLPAGLGQADQLPEPIFTPATKSDAGHDVNVSFEHMKNAIGDDLAQALADRATQIYTFAAQYARDRGIIIADTKLEFGILDDRIILIDELLTPDSSRFWTAATYHPGGSPASFDKQFVRDWLEGSGWNKQAPAPALPADIVAGTAARYREALEWLTGESLAP